ncbi:MAG: 30S ribosomal protein S16 [Chloroflexi bacterium]|nr:30S ribosomal protein S16 [Chloroflexota bacterium]
MSVRIRLTRVGATKRPAYRVIAIDKRRSRDGRPLEILGFYDPLTEPATVSLDTEKINAWIGKGAQPSDTVVKLMAQAERAAAGDDPETPKRATRSTGKPSKKAAAKAAAPASEEAPEATAVAEAPAEGAPADEASAQEGPGEESPAAADETEKAGA